MTEKNVAVYVLRKLNILYKLTHLTKIQKK